MAELLAVNSTALRSSDFTVAAGAKAVLILKAGSSGIVPPKARVVLERKDGANNYTVIDRMDVESPTLVIDNVSAAALTFATRRLAGGAVGVDRE